MDEQGYKFVEFNSYCPTCKYRNIDSIEEPCNECLAVAARVYSSKPINYSKDKKSKKNNGD